MTAGRKKPKSTRAALLAAVRDRLWSASPNGGTYMDAIASAMVDQAAAGNPQAVKWIADQAEGMHMGLDEWETPPDYELPTEGTTPKSPRIGTVEGSFPTGRETPEGSKIVLSRKKRGMPAYAVKPPKNEGDR